MAMTDTETVIAEAPLELLHNSEKLLALNKRETPLTELVYCSWSETLVETDPNGRTLYLVSSVPYYQIPDIPPGSYVQLERLDRHEQGQVFHKLVRAQWDDGFTLEDQDWQTTPAENLQELPFRYVDRSKRFLKNVKAPQGLMTPQKCRIFRKGL